MKTLIISLLSILFMNIANAQLVMYEENDLIGYKDLNGNVIITPKYTVASDFNGKGIASVLNSDGWVYINSVGNEIIKPFIYDNGPDYFAEGFARFTYNNKIGFNDEWGRIVVLPIYDFAEPFNNGFSIVSNECTTEKITEYTVIKCKKYGVIDISGNELLPVNFERIEISEKGIPKGLKDGKWTTVSVKKKSNK